MCCTNARAMYNRFCSDAAGRGILEIRMAQTEFSPVRRFLQQFSFFVVVVVAVYVFFILHFVAKCGTQGFLLQLNDDFLLLLVYSILGEL